MRLNSILSLALLATGVVSQDLAPFKYDAFPLGSIKASGWLQDQLRLEGDGLAGNLFEFYRYVGNSTWVGGGSEYSDLRESATYWFNGIVPLAWSLDDDRLKAQAKKFLDYVIDHQYEDGWLGPEKTRNERVIWGRSFLLMGMVSYAEAEPSEETRIVDSIHKYVSLSHSMLQNNFTGLIPNPAEGDTFDDFMFGVARAHEFVMTLMWLYENHPRDNAEVILDTIDLLFEGTRKVNLDWNVFFTEGNFPTQGTPNITTNGFTHGVNTAEGLRYSSVLYRSTKDESLIQKTKEAVDLMQKYQTTLSGSVSGDEHLGARLPQRGSELCMVVETMFSYAYMYRLHGTNNYADMTERATFNALPGGITADWWAHQYVTQTNQPWARTLEGDNPFFNVDNYAIVYGLEPNYPCCTVNHGQGLPKFVTSVYARNGDDGIVHMLLSPASVQTKINDKDVKVECETNYPFSDKLNYVIESDTDFKFYVRVPEWTVTDSATIAIADEEAQSLSPSDDNLQLVEVKAGTTKFVVTLPMDVRTEVRDGGVAFYRGPLLYASDIEYNETRYSPLDFGGNPFPADQVHPEAYDVQFEPVGEWRYAVDPSSVTVKKDRDELEPLPNPLYVRDGPPTSLEVDAYPIEWPLSHDTADSPPVNPAVDATKKTTIRLIPYGAAKLHIAQFPVAQL